ncbi:MAG: phosphoribosylformylglycinamidine synthase subunit PurL, partial [Candidatus Marinimicrobia bacterium]|nr:phosphoribosylformylglycinamidine synthase subunit PurL [Candidatus Neomarinimicrobiota bacterium]
KDLQLYMNGKNVGTIPAWDLVLGGGAPVYERETIEPEYFKEVRSVDLKNLPEPNDYNDVLLKLLSSHNIADKSWIYRQYDYSVRTSTAIPPGSSSAVIRIKGTNKAIATKTDGNGRYTYLNPYRGGAIAVAESARNVVCSGAKPIAITNCLNFGNPYDPEIYYQFKNAVLGMRDACYAFNTPVTGGNVSFYNESPSGAIFPTPVVGMVGLINDISHITTSWFKNDGDFIMMLGTIKGELGGSEYLKVIHNLVAGDAPTIDLPFEKRVHNACLEAIRRRVANSATDISDGGLAVAIAEACISNPDKSIGASVYISRKLRNDVLFFGESQSVIILSINENRLLEMERIAAKNIVPCVTIGRVKDNGRLRMNAVIDVSLEEIKTVYTNAIPGAMKMTS